MKTEQKCNHLRLFFGSGNYYVFCRDCPASWVHRGNIELADGSQEQSQTDQPVSDVASSRVLPGDRVLSEIKDPIQEALPFHTQEEPKGVQIAWKATINILVPCVDKNGAPIINREEAQDYVSETLRGLFLDWGYVKADVGTKQPDGNLRPIVVLQPYIEGTFENQEPTLTGK